MVSELGISHTYRQDTGMYICQASNAFGQDEMTMHLIVQEVPEQPKNLRINAQQSRSLQLTWSQPFAGNSPIEEYHVQYKVITGKSFDGIHGIWMNINCFRVNVSDTWQTAERISVTGSQTVVNINNLHPAKAYHIRMAAENKLGSSEFSEIVQITTLEEGNRPTGHNSAINFDYSKLQCLLVLPSTSEARRKVQLKYFSCGTLLTKKTGTAIY